MTIVKANNSSLASFSLASFYQNVQI